MIGGGDAMGIPSIGVMHLLSPLFIRDEEEDDIVQGVSVAVGQKSAHFESLAIVHHRSPLPYYA